MLWTGLSRYRDLGLLLLRIGVGLSFVLIHGGPKLLGGPEAWARLGSAMERLGITFAPTFWGFMAMVAEFFGGLCIILGFAFRPACLLLFITMAVAFTQHRLRGDPWGVASHALEMAIVFLALLFIGPGRYSIDRN